ncbi:MAG TPA: FHA domain-containing protein [Steroidobacteraceae bacterium]|nr:FHA domain-containing protein [Steroidobacteraceae bacterium]
MAVDNSKEIDLGSSKEVDLDSTDKLPILEGIFIDEDVEDDSVRLDYAAASSAEPAGQQAEFARPSGLDLPSLAETVRSAEERLARQNAEHEALSRAYEKARDAQKAAGARADGLAAELATMKSALAVEQHRSHELERAVAEGIAAREAARARIEEVLRESERHQGEARTLRDTLAAREISIAQVMHSLGERDAQLNALQREHAQIVPTLEARSLASAQLEMELKAAQARAEGLAVELKQHQQSLAELTARLGRADSELADNRRELRLAKTQADSYLETLRSREWRSGFNQNLYREWDAKIDAARTDHGALQAECDRLRQTAGALSRRHSEQEEAIGKLNAAAAADAAMLAKKGHELAEGEKARTELLARIEALETERKRMNDTLAGREQELGEARSLGQGEAQRLKELLTTAESREAELKAQIGELQAQAATHEEEMTVLMAHLNEARRPVQSIHADIKRLNDDLALKGLSIEQLTEDNKSLRATLERMRGALEEREFLIRRLERAEANNANVLGRLQTSIERLGTGPIAAPSTAGAEYVAELVKLDDHQVFPLGRRTRIGRIPGCEIQIDLQSVSRNHAMILKGAHELIVEDLNSTNGVLVNGRKVSRHALSDGDVLTIGETHFRCVLKPVSQAAELPTAQAAGLQEQAPHPVPPS